MSPGRAWASSRSQQEALPPAAHACRPVRRDSIRSNESGTSSRVRSEVLSPDMADPWTKHAAPAGQKRMAADGRQHLRRKGSGAADSAQPGGCFYAERRTGPDGQSGALPCAARQLRCQPPRMNLAAGL